MQILRSLRFMGTVVALLVGAVTVNAAPPSKGETDNAANKVAATGSAVEVLDFTEEPAILTETIKTSGPTDLLIGLSLECSITTEVTTIGNTTTEETTGSEYAKAEIRIWVEIGGNEVLIGPNDSNGQVVFCNRLYQRETSLFDDEDATIRTFMETRTANAFNWVAFNVGAGTHDVVVRAALEIDVSDPDMATALGAVGKRTLVIEPVKAHNGESL